MKKLVPDYNKLALPVKEQLGGHILIDGRHVADTMKCGHCYTQWIYIKGSGTIRGWCKNCKQVTCGKWDCSSHCSSGEDKLDFMESDLTFEEFMKKLDSKPKIII